jgi:hypothetical protein
LKQIFAAHPIYIFECGSLLREKNSKEDYCIKIDLADYLRKYWIQPDCEENQDIPSKFLLRSLLSFYEWCVKELLEKISNSIGKGKKKFNYIWTGEGEQIISILKVPPTADILLVSSDRNF